MGLKDGDKVSVQFRGICFNQQILMNRILLISGDFPALNSVNADLQLILTSVGAAGVQDYQTPYLACLPATYTLLEIRAQRFKPTRSAYSSVFPVGAVGTNAGAATTANDAAVITYRTAFAGKGQRGNMHIGPMPDAGAAAGLITNAYKATLGVLGNAMLASFIPPGSGSLCVPIDYHKASNLFDLWQSFRLGDTARIMRRRTVGIGS